LIPWLNRQIAKSAQASTQHLPWLFAATLPLIHWPNNAEKMMDVQGFVYQIQVLFFQVN
jgi:hypothetical protein